MPELDEHQVSCDPGAKAAAKINDLLITYPSEAMTMWLISTRVNKPENDDPSILDRAAELTDWQAPLDGSDPGNEHRSGAG